MNRSILIIIFTAFSIVWSYAQDYTIDNGLVTVYKPLSKKQIGEITKLLEEMLHDIQSQTTLDCKIFVTFSDEVGDKSFRRNGKKIIRKMRNHFGKNNFEIHDANPGDSVICKIGGVIG